jgi:hypothetical protein
MNNLAIHVTELCVAILFFLLTMYIVMLPTHDIVGVVFDLLEKSKL